MMGDIAGDFAQPFFADDPGLPAGFDGVEVALGSAGAARAEFVVAMGAAVAGGVVFVPAAHGPIASI